MGYWSDIDVLMQDAAIFNTLTIFVWPWWVDYIDPFAPMMGVLRYAQRCDGVAQQIMVTTD